MSFKFYLFLYFQKKQKQKQKGERNKKKKEPCSLLFVENLLIKFKERNKIIQFRLHTFHFTR